MKHALLSAGVLLLCLIFSLISMQQIMDVCGRTSQLLEQTQAAIVQEDFSAAQSTLDRAEDTWKTKEGFLGVVLSHEDVDEVLAGFSELRQYIQVRDLDDCRAVCARLITSVHHLQEMERLTVSNIL